MNTIRTILTRKRRRVFVLTLISYILFGIGAILGVQNQLFLSLAFVGFAGAVICMLVFLFFIKCPDCKGNLGFALGWPATWDFSVSNKIKFCQFCGTSMDKEIETEYKEE